MNILIVDDSDVCRKMMKQLFMNHSFFHTLFFAKNGLDAIQQIQSHKDEIDVVLMDNEMPVLNGIQAVRQLRDSKFSKPIVGVTDSNGTSLDSFKRCGIDCIFSKPFDKEKLDILIEFLKKDD